MTNSIIVQKYGGATVADPEKIRAVAKRLSELSRAGRKVVVVVSAMGKTTNQLIDLAHQISPLPNRRELDMLLSTGERISMSLLSIALNDLGCPAISFTGSQAGILTDESHVAANVIDINAPRVKEALTQNKIVVLAGFQGVSPKTKEITTLGRGGSDITAIAMAAHLNAERCEILKDVDSVYTADPKLVPDAKPIHELTYPQLLEMTFWGAQFLNYRSAELATQYQVPLYVGPAYKKNSEGTVINSKSNLSQKNKILAINSHSHIVRISHQTSSQKELAEILEKQLTQYEIPPPQILHFAQSNAILTAPADQMIPLIHALKEKKIPSIVDEDLASVTCTYTNHSSEDFQNEMKAQLKKNAITPLDLLVGKQSITALVPQEQRGSAVKALHSLI